MRISKLEMYHYTSSSGIFDFTSYKDDFYCRDRLFRFEIVIFGQVFNIQWWLK